MRLQNEGLEIENMGIKFPATFIIVDWECEAIDQYDDIESVPFYAFEDVEMECYYFNSENEEVYFIPTIDEQTWINDFIEKDATNKLEKQK